MARAPATPPLLKDTSWLDEMNLHELLKLEEELQDAIHAKQEEVKEALRAELIDKARLLGINPVDLLPAHKTRGGSRGEVKPKYRDKRDHTQTWSGRGRPPRWLQERIAAGESKDDYLIR